MFYIPGIGGLEEHVLRTATLSSTIACPAFSEMQYSVVPILRVAIEPTYPSQLPQLVKGNFLVLYRLLFLVVEY